MVKATDLQPANLCSIRAGTNQYEWITGGSRKDIQSELLPCTSVLWYLCRHVWALDQGSQLRYIGTYSDVLYCLLFILLIYKLKIQLQCIHLFSLWSEESDYVVFITMAKPSLIKGKYTAQNTKIIMSRVAITFLLS